MKTGVTVIDHKQEFYKYLDKYFDGNIGFTIGAFEKEGKLELVTDSIDFDEKLESWCGTVCVKIKKMTTEEVVNLIGRAHRPDEVSMEKNVLRLWWD